MKKLLTSIIFLLAISPLNAQFQQGLYTFTNLPLNRLYNPSTDFQNDKEILLPIISHVQVQTELYGLSIQDIYSNKTSANEMIENFIDKNNGNEHIWVNDLVNLFYYGFKDKSEDKFWSFGAYQEAQAYAFYPADLIDLFYNGNKLDRSYKAGDLNSKTLALTVYHAGLTYKPKRKKYTLGGRVKLYNSIAIIDATRNKGTVTTKRDATTNKEYILIDGDLGIRASGMSFASSKSQLIKNSIFSGNFGLGLDLGATYNIDKNWSTSISLIDIGAIYSSQDLSNYKITGTHKFEGVIINETDTTDFWQSMIDRFNNDITSGENTNGFFSTIPPKLFASISYTITGKKHRINNRKNSCTYYATDFFSPKHSFFLTSYSKFLYNYWDWALGLSYMGEITPVLGIQANYLFSPYDKFNIGAGVSFKLDPVLLYISVDNIPGLLDINTAHSYGAFIGISIVM
jgi:hypothetical protein